MYLIDTNVVSEARKRDKANPGVIQFFDQAQAIGDPLYVSVITVGEIRRGIDGIASCNYAMPLFFLLYYLGDRLNSWCQANLSIDSRTANWQ